MFGCQCQTILLLLKNSRNDYKNMKTAVLHVSDVYVSVIGLYSRQGNYVIFAVYPTLHILPAQKYKYKYRCQGNCVKCIKAGHFCKQYIAQAPIKELPIDFHPFSSTITLCHYFHISKTHYQEMSDDEIRNQKTKTRYKKKSKKRRFVVCSLFLYD